MNGELETLISIDKLKENLTSPELVIVDCRFDLGNPDAGYKAYQVSHIQGAVYAHLDRDLSSEITLKSGRHPLPDPHQLTNWLGLQGINNQSQVVVYDNAHGTMAVRLWWLLRWLGHNRVAVLDGGWQKWLEAKAPV